MIKDIIKLKNRNDNLTLRDIEIQKDKEIEDRLKKKEEEKKIKEEERKIKEEKRLKEINNYKENLFESFKNKFLEKNEFGYVYKKELIDKFINFHNKIIDINYLKR
jgi:hypothetical protein